MSNSKGIAQQKPGRGVTSVFTVLYVKTRLTTDFSVRNLNSPALRACYGYEKRFPTLLTLEEHAMLCYGSALIVACSIKMVIYARVSEYLDLVFCKIILKFPPNR